LTLIVALGAIWGCSTPRSGGAWGWGQPKPPTNYFLDAPRLASVKRVAVLPVFASGVGLQAEKDLDAQFVAKLNSTQLFEVVTLSREELSRRFGQRAFHSAGILTDSLFVYIEQVTQADAVMLFDITTYQPYKPIKIGIRGKLIGMRDRQIYWAVDELHDASIRTTSQAAIAYERDTMAPFDKNHRYRSILSSPTRFTSFAVSRCLQSLPLHSISHEL